MFNQVQPTTTTNNNNQQQQPTTTNNNNQQPTTTTTNNNKMTFSANTASYASTNNKISSRAFKSYTNKSEDFENIKKIPRSLKREDNANSASNASNARTCKKAALKNKDARLSYKNRRSINKDWKDFNTQ
jgi:hypothetical protein